MNRTQVIIGISAILLVGAIWVGQFYFGNLRGIWPAIWPAPSDITDILPTTTPEPSGTRLPPLPSPSIPLNLPAGFSISLFAKGLPNARVIVFDDFGNAWVSQPSQGTVTLLEIENGVVVRQNAVFRNMRKPHGLAFDPENKNILYIAEENRVVRAHLYSDAPLEKVVDLPTGGNHTSRTIGFGPDGRLYISVGSTCNVCNESDWRRAKILVVNKDGTGLKEYAKGLRNSVFFTWRNNGEMWATEMGRDLLGDDIPPDEVNVVKEGQNYGWPNCYGKNIHDDDFDHNTYIRNPCQEPFEQPNAIDLQAHSAPLGLVFVPQNSDWPSEYKSTLLVAFHGSWNRSVPTGYKVVKLSVGLADPSMLVPLGGRPNPGYKQSDFVTGWFPAGGRGTDSALGRPVDLVFKDSALYITDDKAGAVYRVTYSSAPVKTCMLRPACLDSTPRCLLPEPAEGWCHTPAPKPTGSTACKTGGCSGELCMDAGAPDVASICLWKEEFACYHSAKCEVQSDGRCGWTQTAELRSCVEASR